MKLLFLTDEHQIHGPEAYLLDLLANLDSTRHEVFVGLPKAGELTYHLSGNQIRFVLFPFPRARSGQFGLLDWLAAVRSAAPLSDYIRTKRIDVVHSMTTNAHLVGGIAARRARVPAIWNVMRWLQPGFLRGLMEASATKIVAPWNCTQQILLDIGIQKEKVVLIPPGIDLRSVLPCPGRVLTERQYERDVFVFGLVTRRSGDFQNTFLNVATQLENREPRARFWTVGGPHTRVFGHMTHLGLRDDMGDIYHALDCVVVPTSESSGRVALEAMAAGRAIIAEKSEHSDLFPEGEAVQVPSSDCGQLMQAMIDLIGDSKRVAELGAAGRRRVATDFAIRYTVERLEALYKDIRE